MSVYHDFSSQEIVQYLPCDVKCKCIKQSTDRVAKINVHQTKNHELALFAYQNEIKEIHTEINKKLRVILISIKDKIECVDKIIIDSHFGQLEVLDNFSSIEQFNSIWDIIRNDIISTIDYVSSSAASKLNGCEKLRSDRVKNLMTVYFDKIKSSGIWDDAKLIDYLDNESVTYNKYFIKNQACFSTILSKLKLQLAVKMISYRRRWESLLLTWRDFLVQKNVLVVKDVISSDEYTKAEEIDRFKDETFTMFQECDIKMNEMYLGIIKGLPYNRQKLGPFSKQVEQMLEDKNNAKKIFLERANTHYSCLVDKLEMKLVNIKDFLFKEASCREEQFIKTFSRFVSEGSDSCELKYKDIVEEISFKMTNNLKIASDVHCYMMTFLLQICGIWTSNAEKIKNGRENLLDELKKCREHFDVEAKIIEYFIDSNINKIQDVRHINKLDILQEKVKGRIDNLEKNSKKLLEESLKIISVYPSACLTRMKEHEESMLKQIGLQKCSKPPHGVLKFRRQIQILDQSYEEIATLDTIEIIPEIDNNELYIKQEAEKICKNFVKESSKVVIEHVGSNKKNHTEVTEILVEKLKNEMAKEMLLREQLHKPRKQNVFQEFEYRRNEIGKFAASFDRFFDCFMKFEEQLNKIDEEFGFETHDLITSIEEAVDKACKNQLNVSKSKVLINEHNKVEGYLWKLEKKLGETVRSSINKIDKNFKIMKKHEDEFVQYATNGKYDFGPKTKLFSEFTNTKERVKTIVNQFKRSIKQQEIHKAKKINTVIQNYKIHYKHCLLDLYFLEMKSSHLSKVRLKIKSASSFGDKQFTAVKNNVKEIKESIKSIEKIKAEDTVQTVTDLAMKFKHGFELIKTVINFLNYRCSSIDVPAQNSLAVLNEKYESFGSEDSSLTDTVCFTKSILNMTSVNSICEQKCSVLIESNDHDNNWIADKNALEKKYITGNVASVYGIGANILDIPNHPFATHMSAATSTSNSFWLSKNPEGLQALKDLKEKKERDERGSLCSIDNDSSPTGSSLSTRIRRLIMNPAGDNDRSSSPRRSLNLEAISESSEDKSREDRRSSMPLKINSLSSSPNQTPSPIPKVALPPVTLEKIQPVRKNSGNQMNMQKVLNLNKTIEYLTKVANRRKRSTYFQKSQKIPIYDFLIMTEEELKNFVFQPVTFFNLPKRKYDVDFLCDNIVSIIEKVKFYLLHLQEDFYISCILFFRQKHLSIKYPNKMPKSSDTAIEEFTSCLSGYLENVRLQSESNVEKVKKVLVLMYKTFKTSPVVVFRKIYDESEKGLAESVEKEFEMYNKALNHNKSLREKLFNNLRPNLAHPQNENVLIELRNQENETRIIEQLEARYEQSMTIFKAVLEDFKSKMESCSKVLVQVAEKAIQVDDIRKITSNENNFEVQKRLRQNLMIRQNMMIITPATNMPASCPDRSASHHGLLHNGIKLISQRNELMLAVLKERDSVMSSFKERHSSIISEFGNLHNKSTKAQKVWLDTWDKSVNEVLQLKTDNYIIN